MRNNALYVTALLSLVLTGFPVKRAEAAPSDIREIRVKVVIDETFVECSSFMIRNKFDSVTLYPDIFSRDELAAIKRWRARTPEELAEKIIRELSRRYERAFQIRIVPIGKPTRVSLGLKIKKAVLDLEYLDLLNAQPCDGADLLMGITTEMLFSFSDMMHNATSKDILISTGGAYPPTGRLFSAHWLYGVDDLSEIVNTLDHEVRHLFGAKHEKETVLVGEKEALYLGEGAALIKQNRDKHFVCTEPIKKQP